MVTPEGKAAIVAAIAASDKRALRRATVTEAFLQKARGEGVRLMADLVELGVPYSDAYDLEQDVRAAVNR